MWREEQTVVAIEPLVVRRVTPRLDMAGDEELVRADAGHPASRLKNSHPVAKQALSAPGENERLLERNRILEAEVLELKQGMETVEERARQELGMVKEGETLYQFVE